MIDGISKHAKARAAQRGWSARELALIRDFGTETSSGIIFYEKDRRALLQRLDHLVGVELFEREGVGTTTYRPTARQQKAARRSHKRRRRTR